MLGWTAQGPHPERDLPGLIRKVSDAVWRQVEQDAALEGMGTTVTAALVAGGVAHWVQVGDSRLCVFRGSRLIQVTTDQNMAQFLVEEGRITPDAARSHPYGQLLDQCVGCPHCEPVTGSFRLRKGDLLLLTTDGLHDALPEAVIVRLLFEPGSSIAEKAESLLQAALESGGEDNITLILARC